MPVESLKAALASGRSPDVTVMEESTNEPTRAAWELLKTMNDFGEDFKTNMGLGVPSRFGLATTDRAQIQYNRVPQFFHGEFQKVVSACENF